MPAGTVLSVQDDAAEGPMVRGKQGPGGGWEGEGPDRREWEKGTL